MEARKLIAIAVSMMLASPVWAAKKKSIVIPKGVNVGVDPYVDEFDKAMKSANAELIAIRTAIMAVTVPPMTMSGALAAGAKAAAEYGAVAGVALKAEAAHSKFIAHVMGWEDTVDLDMKLGLKAPKNQEFKARRDDPRLRPKADPTLRGKFEVSQGNIAYHDSRSTVRTASTSRPEGPGVPKAKKRGRSRATSRVARARFNKPSLKTMSHAYGYNSTGGGVGAGFGSGGLNPSAHQVSAASTIGNSTTGPSSGGAGIAAGGQSVGGGGGLGGSTTGGSDVTDVRPSANPSWEQLSTNQSDVAQKAFERMQERQQEAERKAEQRKREEEQRQQQMMQMAMQMAGQALGAAAQLAGQAMQANQGKQGEAQSNHAVAAAQIPPRP